MRVLRRFTGALAITGLVLLALFTPASATASFNFTLDVKPHPSVFQANTEVEVPLYLVENRAPDVDTSYFSRYPVGLLEVCSTSAASSHGYCRSRRPPPSTVAA